MPSKNISLESNIKGISIRAIIVIFLLVTYAFTIFLKINSETLNSLVMASVGWYFGQKNK
jgi:hypothetical protein